MRYYIYDNTFEGLMTAVFDAYYNKEEPVDIKSGEYNLRLDADFLEIVTNQDKAERVMNAAEKKIGKGTIMHLYYAYLSQIPGRELEIYRYLKTGFSIGHKIRSYLTCDCVKNVNEMAQKTGNEAHLLKGFTRFELMENNVLYAEIGPKTDCLCLLARHFVIRLSGVSFVINDKPRKKAVLYNTKTWEIVEYETLNLPEKKEGEELYKKMWQEFYKALAIKERYNNRCRMTHMPKRFWKYMCEMEGEIQR